MNDHILPLSNNSSFKYKRLSSKLFFFNRESSSYQSKLIQIIPNKSESFIIVNPKGFKLSNREIFKDLLYEILSLYRFITPNTEEFENELRDILESLNEQSDIIINELKNIVY